MSERMSKDMSMSGNMSTARRSCAAIAVAYDSQIPGLPMFKRGIQMDIASAYRWHFTGRVPPKRATLKQLQRFLSTCHERDSCACR